MAEADTEDRYAFTGKMADDPRRIGHGIRIARSVREKHTVWRETQRLFRGGLSGHHGHTTVVLREEAQNVPLDPVVVSDDVIWRFGIAPRISFARRDERSQVEALHGRTRVERGKRFPRG